MTNEKKEESLLLEDIKLKEKKLLQEVPRIDGNLDVRAFESMTKLES